MLSDLQPDFTTDEGMPTAEKVFEEIGNNRPDLQSHFLISYLKVNALPSLPENFFEKYTFSDLTRFNALRASIKYKREGDFKLIQKTLPAFVPYQDQNNLTAPPFMLSILHYMAYRGSLIFLKLFFSEYAGQAKQMITTIALSKVPKENEQPESALSYALKSRNWNCAAFLIDHQAPVNIQNADGITPFITALKVSAPIDILHKLRDEGALISDTIKPLEKKLFTIIPRDMNDEMLNQYIQLLVREAVDLDARDELGAPFIYYTCSQYKISSKITAATKTLISFGAQTRGLDALYARNPKLKSLIMRLEVIRESILCLMVRYPEKKILTNQESSKSVHFTLSKYNPLKIIFNYCEK